MLTKSEIKEAVRVGDIKITPYDENQLNPNSYDLRLSKYVLRYLDNVLDAAQEPQVRESEIGPNGILLAPGELYLMATQEITHTDKYIPCIEGRSSIGRLGISVHATAGFGDLGFIGTWTLEVSVIKPVIIYAGMRICQIYFEECDYSSVIRGDETGSNLYCGKYTGQGRPRSSKVYTEVDEWITNKNRS